MGKIVAEDNGDYNGTPMALISGFNGRPINMSYRKLARVGYAIVSGQLNDLPNFVSEWGTLVATYGDPSSS